MSVFCICWLCAQGEPGKLGSGFIRDDCPGCAGRGVLELHESKLAHDSPEVVSMAIRKIVLGEIPRVGMLPGSERLYALVTEGFIVPPGTPPPAASITLLDPAVPDELAARRQAKHGASDPSPRR